MAQYARHRRIRRQNQQHAQVCCFDRSAGRTVGKFNADQEQCRGRGEQAETAVGSGYLGFWQRQTRSTR